MSILGNVAQVGKSAPNVLKPSGFFNQSFEGINFQRNYMWEIVLPTLTADPSAGLIASMKSGFTPMPGILISKLCQKVSFGDYVIEGAADTTRFGAYMAKYPGTLSVPNLRLTFLKSSPDLVTTYFTQWRKLILSNSGLYFPKSKYSKLAYLVFLDTTGMPTNRYKFSGVWPLSLPNYSLDYESEGVTKIDIELSVDNVSVLY